MLNYFDCLNTELSMYQQLNLDLLNFSGLGFKTKRINVLSKLVRSNVRQAYFRVEQVSYRCSLAAHEILYATWKQEIC